MKKIYLALVAVLLTAIIPAQVIADTPQLTAKNDNGEIKIDITNNIITQKADELLPGLTECREPVTQKLTLKADENAVASLRLTVSSASSTETTPLNNYDIVVGDETNTTTYGSSVSSKAKPEDLYKRIEIGELQAGEEKTYSITYKIIDSTVDVSDVSIELAVKTSVVSTVPPKAPDATLKPKFDFDSIKDNEEFVFDFADEEEQVVKNEDGTTTTPAKPITEIKKVCGQDIPAGRFSVTGNGNLKIASSTGTVKSESVISEKPVSGKSVKTAVILLETGDVLTITPLEGEEKARLKFNKVTTATTTATPTPVKQPAKETKTNPKTDDEGMGVIIGIATCAVLAFVALEILKRRKQK